jgi:hypothetical protein
MDDWARDFFRIVGEIGAEVECLLADASRDMEQAVELVIRVSDELVDYLDKAIAPELDRFLDGLDQSITELAEPVVAMLNGIEEAVQDSTEPIVHIVEPMLTEHPSCVGCRHYHGQTYGGNLLVCAMHPYGWDGHQCPDWESIW